MAKLHHHDLISDIEAFLRESGMGPSYFGKKAVGNSELLPRLKNGGRVWPETELKVRKFIADEGLSHDREAS